MKEREQEIILAALRDVALKGYLIAKSKIDIREVAELIRKLETGEVESSRTSN